MSVYIYIFAAVCRVCNELHQGKEALDWENVHNG